MRGNMLEKFTVCYNDNLLVRKFQFLFHNVSIDIWHGLQHKVYVSMRLGYLNNCLHAAVLLKHEHVMNITTDELRPGPHLSVFSCTPALPQQYYY